VQEASLAARATIICGEQSAAYSDFVDILACLAEDDQKQAAQVQILLAPMQEHLTLTGLGKTFAATRQFERCLLICSQQSSIPSVFGPTG
jgi:hypothetical protein